MAPTTSTRSASFAASVMASSPEEAIERVERQTSRMAGFAVSGRVAVKSARHALYDVEVLNLGGDVDDCWFWLTSYGISPSPDLGSSWENVLGASAP